MCGNGVCAPILRNLSLRVLLDTQIVPQSCGRLGGDINLVFKDSLLHHLPFFRLCCGFLSFTLTQLLHWGTALVRAQRWSAHGMGLTALTWVVHLAACGLRAMSLSPRCTCEVNSTGTL